MAKDVEPDETRFKDVSPVDYFSAKRFGGPTDEKTRSVTIGTTPTQILDPDPNRIAWIIINLSSSDFYVSHRPGVSSSFGTIVTANGGDAGEDVDKHGSVVGKEVHAVAGTGGLTANVIEYFVRRGY